VRESPSVSESESLSVVVVGEWGVRESPSVSSESH